MSLIEALLKWTGLPTWGMEILAILLVAGGAVGSYALWKHHQVDQGIEIQIRKDNQAIEGLKTAAAAKAEQLLHRAQAAEAAYDKEHLANITLTAITGPLLVCDNPHGRSPGLSTAALSDPGDAGSSPAPPVGVSVSPGDPAVPLDRRRLLTAFAALFDDQSAVIREYQSR